MDIPIRLRHHLVEDEILETSTVLIPDNLPAESISKLCNEPATLGKVNIGQNFPLVVIYGNASSDFVDSNILKMPQIRYKRATARTGTHH